MLYGLLVCLVLIFATLYFKSALELSKFKSDLSEDKPPEKDLLQNDDEDDPALYDPLTNLFNYQAFKNRLMMILHWSKRCKLQFGIIFLNIHNFSEVNTKGYEIGDKLLKAVSERVKGCVRQLDTVAHYAGDKFLFLLPQLTKPEMAAYVAQRIEDSLIQPFIIDGEEYIIRVEMGIAIYPLDGQEPDALVKNAHIACNQVKTEKKKGYQFFSKSIQELGQRQLALIEFLQNTEFLQHIRINFVPYVNTVSKGVFYVFASPQVIHPVHGLVSSREVFKLAEKTKKSIEIYEWLLGNTMTQYDAWKDEGFIPEKIAFDVSCVEIEKEEFMNFLQRKFAELNTFKGLLVFQMNDVSLIKDNMVVLKRVEALREMGIEIALDILELGHFTQKSMKQIPLNYLIVDEHLIKSLLNGKPNSILDNVIAMAGGAGITVIANGVDSSYEQTQLEKLGYNIMGGKLFNQAISIES